MSTHSQSPRGKVTAPLLRTQKLSGSKISALTAYDAITARIVDEAGIDVLLVGDSLANTALGYDSTIPVSMDEMLVAVRSVSRSVQRSLIVADMPFGSYQASEDSALENAIRMIQAGAEAVKLEGGVERAPLVRRMVEAGIPVMGHVGLTPQSRHVLGGYRVQGRDPDSAREIVASAKALEEAGAFSIVLEAMPSDVARAISAELEIPSIGIGAGLDCDGQILVLSDLLGLTPGRKPKFVREYADLFSVAVNAVESYRRDIEHAAFPSEAESYQSTARPRKSVAG